MRRIVYALIIVMILLCVHSNYKVIESHQHSIDALNDSVFNVIEWLDNNDRLFNASVLDACVVITDGTGYGSGVAIAPNLILTVGHVIDGLSNIYVIDNNGERHKIISKWRSDNRDVGFVRIEDSIKKYLHFGGLPSVLDTVYIVGTPRNIAFINYISKGIVCKTDLKYVDSVINWNGNYICDAADWCGGSGGPVLNVNGKIVGIYVGLFADVDNFSVFVPVSIIKESLEEYNSAIP